MEPSWDIRQPSPFGTRQPYSFPSRTFGLTTPRVRRLLGELRANAADPTVIAALRRNVFGWGELTL